MNIYKNFLNKEDFKKIEYIIMSDSMPWFFSDGVNKKNNKDFQFTYNFINEGGVINCSSDMINLLNPFKSKLNIKKFYKVKANLLLKDDKIKEHGMHIDNALKKGKTGVFYLNTCNGYTKFEDGSSVPSVANRMILFDPFKLHCSTNTTDDFRRVNINFNYF